MLTFDAKHIKNIVLPGYHGCGKTTLAETMLFEAGLISSCGRVEDRNTVSDLQDIEHKRGVSSMRTGPRRSGSHPWWRRNGTPASTSPSARR